jgi:hypothetical protein
LRQFLGDLFGPLSREITLVPNLLFPGLLPAIVQTATEIVLVQPPPKAWGTSPPWRYNERPDEMEAALAEAYATCLKPACPLSRRRSSRAGVLPFAAVLFLAGKASRRDHYDDGEAHA